MHETEITVLSMRKDGKAVKANLPGEGEQWLTLPENLIGKLEWKGVYHIGWTKTPRQDGGNFYNLKKLGNGAATVTPIRPHVPIVGQPDKDKHIGTLAFLKTFGPIYAAQSDTPLDKFTMANFARQCMQAYDMSLGGQTLPPSADPVDDIEDTF